eukprot:TRINITY_DN58020_c0_g1_i1.p1 TRINITY_DN58020_c0_g1~~TRINITY_DN58020_c0_g1_i1.p1  ORF type:complete len:360 (-),score=47.65 TRINITY_DN58020_c0_g1_i1:273-1352(-)
MCDALLTKHSWEIQKSHPNSQWRRDLVHIQRGLHLEVRPVTPDDDRREVDFFQAQTAHERSGRFLGVQEQLGPEQIRQFTHLNFSRDFAICAVNRATDAFVGVARYCRSIKDATRAELAVAVLKEYQGLGLGSYLAARVFEAAQEAGLHTLVAEMLKGNVAPLHLLNTVSHKLGWQQRLDRSDPDLDVMYLSPAHIQTTDTAQQFEERLKLPVPYTVDKSRHPHSLWRQDLVYPGGLCIEVRPSDVDDKHRLSSFAKICHRERVRRLQTAASEVGPEGDFLDFTTGFTLVAIDRSSDCIVGLAHFHRDSDWSCLNTLTSPSYSGLGIGDFLASQVLSAARSEVLGDLQARSARIPGSSL